MSELTKAILDRYPAIARPTSTPVALGNAGGLSGARLWRFESARGPIVARLWPEEGPSPSALRVIHGWLAATSDLGFVPIPLPTIDGRSFVESGGRIWELAPWMPGKPCLANEPDLPGATGSVLRPRADRAGSLARGRSTEPAAPEVPRPVDLVRAAFRGLAAFHTQLASGRTRGNSPGLIARSEEIPSLMAGEFDSIRLAIDRRAADSLAPVARRWLDLARSLAPRMLDTIRQASTLVLNIQPCLRDARPDHFLFVGDRMTGLVDFGAMGRESVAADLARLVGECPGIDREAALDSYRSIRPIEADEWAAIEAFERANALLGAGRWVRWHFVDGRVFDDPGTVERGLKRGVDRLMLRLRP